MGLRKYSSTSAFRWCTFVCASLRYGLVIGSDTTMVLNACSYLQQPRSNLWFLSEPQNRISQCGDLTIRELFRSSQRKTNDACGGFLTDCNVHGCCIGHGSILTLFSIWRSLVRFAITTGCHFGNQDGAAFCSRQDRTEFPSGSALQRNEGFHRSIGIQYQWLENHGRCSQCNRKDH